MLIWLVVLQLTGLTLEKAFTPAEVRKQVPKIHVCSEQEGARILTRQPTDAEYEAKEGGSFRFSVEGNGTRSKPYRYTGPASVSPYFGIIDLWFRYRFTQGGVVFIQVDDWILVVMPNGVVSRDGYYTKFVP